MQLVNISYGIYLVKNFLAKPKGYAKLKSREVYFY